MLLCFLPSSPSCFVSFWPKKLSLAFSSSLVMSGGRGAASVHFKFNNTPDYSTITFDGTYISLSELKRQIFSSLGDTSPDCDLRVTNAQTNEGIFDFASIFIGSMSFSLFFASNVDI